MSEIDKSVVGRARLGKGAEISPFLSLAISLFLSLSLLSLALALAPSLSLARSL